MEELEGYKKEKLTIDIGWANAFGLIVILPIAIVYGLPYYLVWMSEIDFAKALDEYPSRIPMYTLVMLVGIVIHELIHGLVWAYYAKRGFRSIKFGVLWKMITPYCHCKEPLKVKQYIMGAIAPAIILGVLPGIIAIPIKSFGMLLFGIFFTVAACGDFLIIQLLWKENWEDLVQDHPSEAGCYIYRKNEM
jgi:hypothetical protein